MMMIMTFFIYCLKHVSADEWMAAATFICCLFVFSCEDGGTTGSFPSGVPGKFICPIDLFIAMTHIISV